MTAWRTAVALVPSTARRPESWLALTGAAACGWLLDGDATAAAVVACGGLVAVAAIGDRPAAWGGQVGVPRAAVLARAAWPIAGGLVVTVIRLALAQPASAASVAGLVGWAAAVTAWLVAPRSAARSASLARAGLMPLAAAALAAAATAVVAPAAGRGAAWGAAGLAFAAVGVAERVTGSRLAAEASGSTGFSGSLTVAGAGGVSLPTTVAMGSSLVGMMLFLFLLPDAARAYALLVAALFVCLALPEATVGAGGWAGRSIAAAAAGRPTVPGTLRQAARVVGVHVALLGWPAVVAAALDPARAAGPAEALVCLVALATLTLAAAAACWAWPRGNARRGDSPRAVVLCLVALVVASGLRGPSAAAPAGRSPLPSPAASPGRGSVLSGRPVPATLPQSPHPAPPAETVSPGALS